MSDDDEALTDDERTGLIDILAKALLLRFGSTVTISDEELLEASEANATVEVCENGIRFRLEVN